MSESERDQRLSNRGNASSPERQSRVVQDRPVVENRELSNEERLEMFRNSLFQSALPPIPAIPGYHICWLTTTDPRNTIEANRRLGYEPIRPEECPGFELVTTKTGEYAGCIGVNEMIAFKLPNELYEMYMNEAHHEQPLAEEEKLKSVLEVIAQEARDKGADVELGDGTAALGKAPARPSFEGFGPDRRPTTRTPAQ